LAHDVNSDFLHLEVVEIAKELEPTPTQKADAKRSQRAIRDALNSGNMSTRIVDEYLSGSYARHTAVYPLDDVDIIFLIDPSHWEARFFSDTPSPRAVLQTFARAIRLRYEQSRVQVQRRSVGLKLYALDIDVVPAITTERNGYIQIPDIEKGDWILTAPQIHSELASEINAARHNLFKPLVKVLKGWNGALPDKARLKSFSIETMALRLFRHNDCSSLFDGCLYFFDFLCSRFAEATSYTWRHDFGIGLNYFRFEYEMLDMAETGSNLFAGLSENRRDEFLTRALTTRDLLLGASNESNAEEARARLRKALRATR
jgi:hypothetical protein